MFKPADRQQNRIHLRTKRAGRRQRGHLGSWGVTLLVLAGWAASPDYAQRQIRCAEGEITANWQLDAATMLWALYQTPDVLSEANQGESVESPERIPAASPREGVGQQSVPTPATEPLPAIEGTAEDPLTSLTTDIRPSSGMLPTDHAAQLFRREGVSHHGPGLARGWAVSPYAWEASALYHGPLYFEEVNVERHGRRVPLVQPVISAASFYGRIPALPYLMALDPPWEHKYVLGYYRPGSCVDFPMRLVPLRIGPGAVQAAVVAGLILAIP